MTTLSTPPYSLLVGLCQEILFELVNKGLVAVSNGRYSITQSGLDFLRNTENKKHTIEVATLQIDGINTLNGKWVNKNKWWLYPAIATLAISLIVALISLYLSMVAHKHGRL